MKNKVLYAAILFLSLTNFIANAQLVPTGNRLKDIPAGPKIGTLIQYGDNTRNNTNGMFVGPDATKEQLWLAGNLMSVQQMSEQDMNVGPIRQILKPHLISHILIPQ
jgi:hypothetical protein